MVRHPLVARIVEAYDARAQARDEVGAAAPALHAQLGLSLQFADAGHRPLLPRHRVARWLRAALAGRPS